MIEVYLMKRILIFLFAIWQTSLLFATVLSCDYIYMNGEKWLLMEEECALFVRDGIIVKQQVYQNYKKEGLILKDAQWELEKRFPFGQFPELEGKRSTFLMRDFKMSPDGHFLDCFVQVKLSGKKRGVNNQQHPIIVAFKAAMKAVFPWKVLSINGKYTIDCNNYAISLRYPILTAHTTSEYLEVGVPVCYLNMRKDTVIPFGKYRYCNSDTIRHIGFVLDKEIVCIDNKGNELFDVVCFDNGADPVKEGTFRIKDKAGKMGFADTLGHVIIQPQFAFAFPFKNGKAKVTYSGGQSFVDEWREHWTWESNYWFYIDKKGYFVTDNPAIKSVRKM